MSRIEPHLVPVVTDLERGLRELGVPFGIIGALVPELLLDARPRRMTNDADVTVVVKTLADFDALKDRLADYGFTRTRLPHRLQHRDGGFLDILPFSDALAPDGRLQLEDGFVFNMAGFKHVIPSAISTPIEGGPALPLAPLPLYALLKFVAFSDRKEAKDLGGVLHCLEHYLDDDERCYGAEHEGEGVPFEYTCAVPCIPSCCSPHTGGRRHCHGVSRRRRRRHEGAAQTPMQATHHGIASMWRDSTVVRGGHQRSFAPSSQRAHCRNDAR